MPVGNQIKLVHHGVAIPARKIEEMIKVMNYLDDRFTLDLFLTIIPEVKSYAKKLALNNSSNPKITFQKPVPYTEICRTLNQYDVGLYILPPTNFNNLYSLPNKFFDFIQARLCLAVSPNPEMVKLVRKYDLGVVSADFTAETMAGLLKNLTAEKIAFHKQQSHIHAKTLSADTGIQKIKELVTGLSVDKTS
jgi:hypothetical protein